MTVQLIMKLVVSPPKELAMPVLGLQYVEGNGKHLDSSLLIFGGQVLDQPPVLSLASLDNSHKVRPQTAFRPSFSLQSLPCYQQASSTFHKQTGLA